MGAPSATASSKVPAIPGALSRLKVTVGAVLGALVVVGRGPYPLRSVGPPRAVMLRMNAPTLMALSRAQMVSL